MRELAIRRYNVLSMAFDASNYVNKRSRENCVQKRSQHETIKL